MNKLKLSILALSLLLFVFGCKKETKNVSDVVTASYPVITINGPQFVSIPVGGSFTDQGSAAADPVTGETSLSPISVTNDIDAATPGFYTVAYKYKNKYGYTSTATRFVLVTNVDATQDISGTYLRGSAGTANVTKIATGLYKTDNAAGVPLPASEAFRATAYFGFTSDSLTIEMPVQESPEVGPVGARSCVYENDGAGGISLKWYMVAGPFNTTNQRVFIKQ